MKLPSFLIAFCTLLPVSALAKPPVAKDAQPAESANLRRARATVDKLTNRLTGMVKQAEAPGVDAAKVQALVAEFQAHVASQRQESDALEKVLTDDEKATLGKYIAEKVTPLLGRFEAVYKRVQAEADPQLEERQKALVGDLESLAKDAETVLDAAKKAGKDPAQRAAAIAKLEALETSQHALYHRGIAETQAAWREQWEVLFAGRVERPLLRSERVLRMALQTASPEYQKAQAVMADLTTQVDKLHGEWHAVQDWPTLKTLQERESTLQAAVQALAQSWRLLAVDEAAELDAVARETLVPAVERMAQDSAQARKRLPPEAGK